jgi:hypothetical protein
VARPVGNPGYSRAYRRLSRISCITRACRERITGGVDIHADVPVAAALDPIGGLLGVREFPATPAFLAGWASPDRPGDLPVGYAADSQRLK